MKYRKMKTGVETMFFFTKCLCRVWTSTWILEPKERISSVKTRFNSMLSRNEHSNVSDFIRPRDIWLAAISMFPLGVTESVRKPSSATRSALTKLCRYAPVENCVDALYRKYYGVPLTSPKDIWSQRLMC